MGKLPRTMGTLVAIWAGGACATLGGLQGLVQPPRFEESSTRRAEVRLLAPSLDAPLGGAGVRLWVEATNPNAFGFTLSRLRGDFLLDDTRAATIDLPLGLPLQARGETEFPVDVVLSFADMPGLGRLVRRAIDGEPTGYRVNGVIGIDAGRFGSPEFGPMTLLRGTIGSGTR
jgi:hypothetical protein